MPSGFRKADFSTGELELRFEENVVDIYGSATGLTRLSDLCKELVADPNRGHIHLETCAILTRESLRGAIAIFEQSETPEGVRRWWRTRIRSRG